MWREFKGFLIKQNVVALAIAVVMGTALNKVVTAVVASFIMPIVAGITSATGAGDDWRTWTLSVGSVTFGVGDFLGAVIDFLIVGFVAWRFAKIFVRPDAPPAPMQTCPFCRSTIDMAATRCPNCTSHLAPSAKGLETAGV